MRASRESTRIWSFFVLWAFFLTTGDPAGASGLDASREMLAQGMWSAGRQAELEGEYGLAAMNYFRSYHLYDVLFQEGADTGDRAKWSERKIQTYTDGLNAVRQYEDIRGVRVDVRRILEQTRPLLVTGPKPRLRVKLPEESKLMSRPLPSGDITQPPEVDENRGVLFGTKTFSPDIPFGGKATTTLLVRGRKFIGWTASSTKFKKPSDARKNTKDVKVDQQLQIQIGGSVGFQFQDALTVNVNFDDAESDQNQKQAISIKFDPKKETVTPLGRLRPVAEFGDVDLSLTGTSYAAYNKSLFGLTGTLTFDDFHFFDVFRAKSFKAKVVATQTKGVSAHKEFSGQNTLTVTDINDINYVARIYYDMLAELSDAAKAAKLAIKVGSEKVFRDDRSIATNTANTLLAESVSNSGTTFTGDFDVLISGQNYFIDYQLGIIQFKSSIAANAVLAVSFTTADGTVVTKKLIKDENVSDTFRIYELKNRYSLGSTNIIRNDPDFIVQIRDLSNKAFFDGDSDGLQTTAGVLAGKDFNYNEFFGLDISPLDGRTDEKNIDFDFGILKFPDSSPFIATKANGDTTFSNTEIYTSNVPTTKYKIHVEYIQKTNIYLLNPSIVKGSEIITVDGVKMVRDLDYFIDYSSGFLQFLRPEIITSKSLIVVDYEYFPFTSKSNQTLIGTSLNMDISPNVSWAATFVSNFDDKPAEKPKVGEEPKKIDISDFAVNVNPIGMLRNTWSNWREPPKILDKVSLSFNFENASSRFDFNTNGEAILSDFEDAGLITQLGISQHQWRPEIPDGFDTGGSGDYTISQISEQGHLDALANVSSENLRNQSSLKIDYTFSTTVTADTYLSVSFHISDVAQDLSKRTFLEFWIKDANNPDITLDMGILNEDADGDGLETEDANKDNLLNSGEDAGITLAGIKVGAGNSILDSEDRDRDGTLDLDQAFFRANLSDAAFVDTSEPGNGWRQYKVFLSTLPSAGTFSNQTVSLKTIKDIRLTFMRPIGSAVTGGSILINDISIQGVIWEDPNFADTKIFTVGLVSSRTDPNFTPPTTLAADIQSLDAQALSLTYSSLVGQQITKFLPSVDIRLSLYKKLFYWLKNGTTGGAAAPTNAGDTFIFRFGPDENNYFEVTNILTTGTDWTQYPINLEQVEEELLKLNLDTSPPFNVTKNGVRFFGAPSLDRIKYLGAGIKSDTRSGKVYLDEITVKDVEEERGTANKFSFSSAIFNNLVTFNGNQEQVDNTFRPIGRINYTGVGDYISEDRKTQGYSGTVNLSKLTFLDRLLKLNIPVSVSKNKAQTFINPDLVENVKRSDLGSKTSDGKSLSFSVSRNSSWPTFSAAWNQQNDNVSQKSFVTKQENTDKNYSVSYGKTHDRKIFWFVPIGRTFGYNASFSRSTSIKDRDILLGTEKNSYQKSVGDGVGLGIHYTISRWFDWNFNINQSLSRQTSSETLPLKESARSRSFSWSWPFPTFVGLTPSLNWTFSFAENFNIETENKSIASNGGFGAGLGLQPERWWRLLKFLTIAYSYNINGNASYQNVPERFGLSAVYDDFYQNIFYFWKGGNLEITSDTLVLLRNSASTARGHSFGGGIKIWNSLSTTYSTAFNRSEIQSLNSIDVADAFSFNLNNTLDLKSATRIFNKKNSAALAYSYALNSSANKTTEVKNISNSLSFPVGWTDRLRSDLGYSFTFGSSKDRLSLAKNQNSGANLGLSYLLSNPFKMTSFTGNFLRFENRLEMRGGMNWSNAKNVLDGVKKGDSMNYGGNLGLVYDLRENFRIDGTATHTVSSNEVTPDDDKNITTFTATAELRF